MTDETEDEGVVSFTGSFTAQLAPQYRWSPQPDITTWELTQCLPLVMIPYIVESFIPAGCQRHFIKVPQ